MHIYFHVGTAIIMLKPAVKPERPGSSGRSGRNGLKQRRTELQEE